ncbi:transmembrane protein 17B-like isoform X1 [Dromaius novaehollandiae]
MAAHTPLPRNIRWGLTTLSGSLFINNKTRDSGSAQIYHPAREVLASLPLQMMLYFNVCYFPFWCLAEGTMLQLKYSLLPRYYQLLLAAAFLILSLAEGFRLYLGYIGNLQEKVRASSMPLQHGPCAQHDRRWAAWGRLCWGRSCGYSVCPLCLGLRYCHLHSLLGTRLVLSKEGNTGTVRTWRQGTKGTSSPSCFTPPHAVSVPLSSAGLCST